MKLGMLTAALVLLIAHTCGEEHLDRDADIEDGAVSGGDAGIADCAELGRESCEAAAECAPVTAVDVSRADPSASGGSLCWSPFDGSVGAGVFVACATRPRAGNAEIAYVVDPSTGHCLYFASSSDVPGNWTTTCEDGQPQCGP